MFCAFGYSEVKHVAFENEKIETMPVNELREYQLKMMKSVAKKVYENNAFYRRRFKEEGIKPDDIKTIDDISKLPFTYKKDLRDNYPYGLLSVPMESIVRWHLSSGTTGKPTAVAYTTKDIDTWATLIVRAMKAAGASSNDVVQNAYGYGLFTGGLGFHYGAEKLGAKVIPVSTGNTQRQIEIMKDFGVTVITCTPSYAVFLAETMEKMGIDPEKDLDLKIGFIGAEPWSKKTRERIEKMLGLRAHGGGAYDHYGLSEMCGPGVGAECTAQEGLHIWGDHFYLEVIDPETKEPVSEGEKGVMVLTNFTKDAMPLIRYWIGDITIADFEPCSCGRTHPRLPQGILGRADDMVVVRGINVFPSQVEFVLMKFPELGEAWQMIIDRKGALDSLTVEVERKEDVKIDDTLVDRVKGELKAYLNVKADVVIKEPNTLPRYEGKAKRVIDRREFE